MRQWVSGIFLVAALTTSYAARAQGGAPAEASPGRVTFTKDILPILQAYCQDCHRPGQIAPMSLIEYAEVRPWAKAIRTAVAERKMPPFHANAPLGHFQDDNRLAEAQIDLITRWIDADAPRGDLKDAPPRPAWAGLEWVLGTPDLVLEFPEYTSKGNDADEEILLYSDHVFPQEVWVQAIEFKSTNYRVIHHTGINGVDPGFFVPEDRTLDSHDEHLAKFGGKSNGGGALMAHKNHLYTWLPGQRVERRLAGDAFRIGAGERIVMQTHIAPTAEPVTFKISLGLEMMDGELYNESQIQVSFMRNLRVPPRDPKYVVTEWKQFGRDSLVTGFNVHMHLRGKSSSIRFHYLDGRVETVFDVPQYSFDWQRVYFLQKPYMVPAGTKIEYTAEWDNSANNPLNPDPAAEVVWGGLTTDEMYGGTVLYTVPRKEPLRIVNGVATTPTVGRSNAGGATVHE